MKIQAEVVNGKCPTCSEYTTLVGLDKAFYRCMNCGADLEQHVNGKITYLPIMTSPRWCYTFCKRMERWLKNLNRLRQEINLEKEDLENIKNH